MIPTPHRRRRLLPQLAALSLFVGLLLPITAGTASAHVFKVLVFSKTAAFRHSSVDEGVAAVLKLGVDNGFTVDTTEDATKFTDANLAQYDAVVFMSTTGDVLDNTQQGAFERYIKAGGGYAGVHAASDTEYDWAWYGGLVGAYFKDHPAQSSARIKVEDPAHPSTAGMSPVWSRFDEWYNFRTNPRDKVHVLASLDETSYSGGSMGVEHPISWCQNYDGGRSWYTGLGHTEASFTEPQFLQHLLGGIKTAAGDVEANCAASQSSNFQKVTLDDNTSNPMELAIAKDGRVFYIDRNGAVKIIKSDGTILTAGTLSVNTTQEFGLLGLALDPGFATNGYVWLYYSPAGASTEDHVSRFKLNGDVLDLTSEKVVLKVPVQRAECCHAGGALEFDMNGNLFIATGDNTNPFASSGYTPIDEGAGRAAWDAQRTSGNTNSLSGKILRIKPAADGTYTNPAGNLFAPGTAKTRPEIYAMGFRNPFRIGIDPKTNNLFVADYGPDAQSVSTTRGPDGRVEWNLITQAGNFGWPYCVGANTPYNDYNFQTATAGSTFNCAAPTNNSPNNTGLTTLPAAVGTPFWMGKTTSGVPEIGGAGSPMTSGAYRYDPALVSDRKWPQYWDGKAMFANWGDGRLFSFQLDTAGNAVTDISRFMGGTAFARPHAMQFGPDGALYLIEWGSGFGGNNADSGVYRIDYTVGGGAPTARATANKTNGPTPLAVQFNGSTSSDPEGQALTYAWDFTSDGTTDSTAVSPSFTYSTAGNYSAKLTVRDPGGKTSTSSVAISAGNSMPTVAATWPKDGGFFDFGDTIRWDATASDPEDGTAPCASLVIQPGLGHDEHSHGYNQYSGCTGTFPLPGDEGHIGADIFGTVSVKYTDRGAPGVAPLTAEKVLELHPRKREAEFFDITGRVAGSTSGGTPGVQTQATGDTAGGGLNIGWVEPGDWFGWNVMNLTNITKINLRAASPSGATWQIRHGDPSTGTLVGTVTVPATGAWQTYGDYSVTLTNPPTGSGKLYFVQTAGASNINWIQFDGKGMTDNLRPTASVTATPTTGTAPLAVDFTASGTDPEGSALTYTWDFGNGETGVGAAVRHTYLDPGTYTAKVTARDSGGAVGTATKVITVGAPATTTCLSGKSDGFTGTSLDHTRWSRIVRENQDLSVAGGHLQFPLTATDIAGAGTTPATPNIVLQPLASGAFTATTRVTLPARLGYQQAGLIVYGDDNNYLKVVLMGTGSTPSKANRVFQFSSETAGTLSSTNTAGMGDNFPDTYFVRMTSTDGVNVTASYSADGVTFTPFGTARSISGIANKSIGVFGLANRASALPITAKFDSFTITPDSTVGGRDDEFTGPFDQCRWSTIVRPDASKYRVNAGNLEIDTSGGDIYQATAGNPNNFMLQSMPAGDWTIQTKVDGSSFNEAYQQAGLMVYKDDANYLKLDYLASSSAKTIELRNEVDNAIVQPAPNGSGITQGVWHLRLVKRGDTYAASYSVDGTAWTVLGTVTNTAVAGSKVGLYAFGGPQAASKTAKFDYYWTASP
ncbi:ThuA domain-containing protein [Actinokineospora sp. HUAS TT18]|uniref:ThuA domain-containing protein n=1 Tax=Actinokineospora sp. HUAS TT18 TaxID=3447451 RepID=UPI003F52834C